MRMPPQASGSGSPAGAALQGVSGSSADPGGLAVARHPVARASGLALVGFHGLESVGRRSSAYWLRRSRPAVSTAPRSSSPLRTAGVLHRLHRVLADPPAVPLIGPRAPSGHLSRRPAAGTSNDRGNFHCTRPSAGGRQPSWASVSLQRLQLRGSVRRGASQAPATLRPRRFARPRRFSPPGTFRVYCTPVTLLGFPRTFRVLIFPERRASLEAVPLVPFTDRALAQSARLQRFTLPGNPSRRAGRNPTAAVTLLVLPPRRLSLPPP